MCTPWRARSGTPREPTTSLFPVFPPQVQGLTPWASASASATRSSRFCFYELTERDLSKGRSRFALERERREHGCLVCHFVDIKTVIIYARIGFHEDCNAVALDGRRPERRLGATVGHDHFTRAVDERHFIQS